MRRTFYNYLIIITHLFGIIDRISSNYVATFNLLFVFVKAAQSATSHRSAWKRRIVLKLRNKFSKRVEGLTQLRNEDGIVVKYFARTRALALIYRRRYVRDVPAYFMRTIPTSLSRLSVILFFCEQSVFAIVSKIREHTYMQVFRIDAKLKKERGQKGKTTDMGD